MKDQAEPPGKAVPLFTKRREGFGVARLASLRRSKRSCGGTQEIDGSRLRGNFFTCAKEYARIVTISELTPEQVSIIKARLVRGEYQHRIAADFDLNQGRISEISTGKRFADIPPAFMEAAHV